MEEDEQRKMNGGGWREREVTENWPKPHCSALAGKAIFYSICKEFVNNVRYFRFFMYVVYKYVRTAF